jgi:hypothetical protein
VSLERVVIRSDWPRTLSVLVIALASSFSGCGASPFYDGDGVVRGRLFGPLHVELGRIDLSKPEASRFTFAGLSRGSFIVKLVVPDAGPYPDLLKPPVVGPPPLDAVVRVVMVNEKGERVIDEQAALGLWTRTTQGSGPTDAVLFRVGRGNSRETVVLLADRGWGTYFNSRRRAHYSLEVQVVQPTGTPATATVILECLVESL